MEVLIRWERLLEEVRPYYPKAGKGRVPYELESMLPVHCMQLFYNLSDPATEDVLYEIEKVRRFTGISLKKVPDETTILNFRHLLERHGLSQVLFESIKEHLSEEGLILKEGTIVDASIMEAPTSTKNRKRERDPEIQLAGAPLEEPDEQGNGDPAEPLQTMENSPPESRELHRAAAAGDVESVKRLIDENPDGINSKDSPGGLTPLHEAARAGHADVAQVLIAAGADPNIPNRYGKTPLYWATGGRTVEFVNLLIQAGSDVNAVDRFGSIPLREAATCSDDVTTAKALINAGANVNPQPSRPPTLLPGGTPLSIAASKNNIKMVKLLASHGADVNGRNDAGNPPVQVAAFAGLPELIKLLIEAGSPVNVQDQVGDTPLHDAALQGHVEAARVLVGAGAAVNAKNNRRRTPLDLAEQNDHERLAEVLKAAGGRQGV